MADPSASIVNHLGGYHRCFLDDPIHLEFVSENLCSMLGYSKPDLVKLVGMAYTALMHPDDTAIFDSFVFRLAAKEGCESVVYRLIKEDGSIIRVVDTMTSIRGNDGCMRGYSVVCEIPDESNALTAGFPSEKIAVMRVSGTFDPVIEKACGIAPRLLGIGDKAEGLHFLEYVSMADRDKVKAALERAYENEYSGMESCAIVSAEGRGIKCDLWVECINPGGCLEDGVFCVKAEVDLNYRREDSQIMSFSKMLFSSFAEDVFEVDRFENSVRYICHSDKRPIEAPLNVRMNADDFLVWLLEFVSSKDRDSVRQFCIEAKSLKSDWAEEIPTPTKIRFEMLQEGSFGCSVVLVMVPVSQAKYFLCFGGRTKEHCC